jgi:beta-lactam-binding protein with PASTA domain
MIDVLGRELETARSMLEAAGLQVQVEETRTPRRVTLEGSLRVVRQTLTEGTTVRLVVTRERYVPVSRGAE